MNLKYAITEAKLGDDVGRVQPAVGHRGLFC